MAYAPQFNAGLAGKSPAAATADKVPTPGKQTQVEAAARAQALEAAPPTDLVAEVEARVGKTFSDGAGYTFKVIAPARFEIVATPDGTHKGKLDRSQVQAWSAVAKLMVLKLPIEKPAPAQQAAPVQTPVTTSAPAPVQTPAPAPTAAPSTFSTLLDRFEHGLHDAMNAASRFFGGGSAPEAPPPETTPAALAGKPLVLDVAPVDVKQTAAGASKPAAPATPTPAPATGAQGANTLELARGRAALGDEGTTYKLAPSKEERDGILSGAADQTVFYCSGLSVWTLAASGIDVNQPIRGTEKPYEFKNGKTRKTKSGAVIEDVSIITLKMIIDGEPEAVAALATARKNGQTQGGLIEGDFKSEKNGGEGHLAAWDGDTADLAGRGAAGAFVLTGIGTEVPEAQQKPGDFVQIERRGADGKHHGDGHAWQVNEVLATGSAMFGYENSPVPEDRATTKGWRTTKFQIFDTTDPLLVGEHTVIMAARLEANVKTSMNENKEAVKAHKREVAAETTEAKKAAAQAAKDQKGMSKADRAAAQEKQKAETAKAADERTAKNAEYEASLGDGGVQITGLQPVPAGEAVFVGRLGASRWSGWAPATAASAAAHVAGAPATSPTATTTPTATTAPTSTPTATTAPTAPTAPTTAAAPTPAPATTPTTATPTTATPTTATPTPQAQAAQVPEAPQIQEAAPAREGPHPHTGGRITVEE